MKDTRGEFTVEGAIKLLIGSAALVLCISIFACIFQANKLSLMAADVARSIEIAGCYDRTAVDTQVERLAAASGLNGVTCTVEPTGQIQFGDEFTVTLSYTGSFGIGGLLSIPVPFREKVIGRSEKYWK